MIDVEDEFEEPEFEEEAEEGYTFKSLLGDIANLAAGKPDPRMSLAWGAAKTFFTMSGFDEKISQAIVVKALTSPSIAKSLFYIRSLICQENAEMLVNAAMVFMIPHKNAIARLLGAITIGLVHKKMPLEEQIFGHAKASLKGLLIDEDEKVKDAATVILESLGDSMVDKNTADEAKERLKKEGVDLDSEDL